MTNQEIEFKIGKQFKEYLDLYDALSEEYSKHFKGNNETNQYNLNKTQKSLATGFLALFKSILKNYPILNTTVKGIIEKTILKFEQKNQKYSDKVRELENQAKTINYVEINQSLEAISEEQDSHDNRKALDISVEFNRSSSTKNTGPILLADIFLTHEFELSLENSYISGKKDQMKTYILDSDLHETKYKIVIANTSNPFEKYNQEELKRLEYKQTKPYINIKKKEDFSNFNLFSEIEKQEHIKEFIKLMTNQTSSSPLVKKTAELLELLQLNTPQEFNSSDITTFYNVISRKDLSKIEHNIKINIEIVKLLNKFSEIVNILSAPQLLKLVNLRKSLEINALLEKLITEGQTTIKATKEELEYHNPTLEILDNLIQKRQTVLAPQEEIQPTAFDKIGDIIKGLTK